MTTTPSLDIIIPVWNSPTETRACIVSILDSTDSARLIIVNNACDRATELMLEEFSDHLGNRAIYMTMERNIGFVPAVNRALRRSDADWALIVRPTSSMHQDAIRQILNATAKDQAGIITPYCPADIQLPARLLKSSCSTVETSEIGFSALALSRRIREAVGLFDEELDGGRWCLHDYRHRAEAHGFRTYLLPATKISGTSAIVLGSSERRRRQEESAAAACRQRWGTGQHLAVYLPKDTSEQHLTETLDLLLAGARRGHRFELFLHRRQHGPAVQQGADCLHCDINLHRLSALAPLRSLAHGMSALTEADPALQPVCGLDGIPFPGYDAALPHDQLCRLAKP